MAAMMLMIINLIMALHYHHCSHSMAIAFGFTTLFTQAFEGCTFLYTARLFLYAWI